MAGRFELAFIGAGNMTEGIVAGVLGKGVLPPGRLIVADPLEERRRLFAESFHVAVTDDNRFAVRESRCVMIAVKPQVFAEVVQPLAGDLAAGQLVVSIMAGIGTRRIAATIGAAGLRVVRVMPNLPIRVGAGVAGVCGGEHATPEDVAFVCRLFDAGGRSLIVPDERLIDAVTAVSGSGPAYFYYVVEAIAAAGVEAGLSQADALQLAEHACLGAARMMIDTGEPPAELRRKVTSKGGTTQAAIELMERCGVGEGIRQGVLAAFRRARELGAG